MTGCNQVMNTQKNATGNEAAAAATAIIELRVRNHPGVMSHITGLFARRAFNLDAILCAPDAATGAAESRMFLLVARTPRLEQIERQLARLHDVLALRQRTDLTPEIFQSMTRLQLQ